MKKNCVVMFLACILALAGVVSALAQNSASVNAPPQNSNIDLTQNAVKVGDEIPSKYTKKYSSPSSMSQRSALKVQVMNTGGIGYLKFGDYCQHSSEGTVKVVAIDHEKDEVLLEFSAANNREPSKYMEECPSKTLFFSPMRAFQSDLDSFRKDSLEEQKRRKELEPQKERVKRLLGK